MTLLAQGTPIGNFTGIGNIANTGTTPRSALTQFTTIISTVIGVLTVSAGLWFIFQIFGGSVQWISAGGDKQALETARKRLTNAIIGLLLVVISYALIGLIGAILGIDLIFIGDTIKNIVEP